MEILFNILKIYSIILLIILELSTAFGISSARSKKEVKKLNITFFAMLPILILCILAK